MIDEDELRRLLADAAATVPPPGRAPQALLDAVAQDAAVGRASVPPSRRRALAALAAAAVVAVLAVGVVALGDERSTFQQTGQSIGDEAASDGGSDPSGGGGTGASGVPAEAPRDLDAGGDGAGGTGSGVPAPSTTVTGDGLSSNPSAPAPLVPGQVPDSARIVRTGSLELEVREGAFDGTVDRIVARTIGLGGYVAESTTSEAEESPSGSIVVRVPGESFETLVADLRELGDVKAVTSKGTDVTAQFTDLEARLTALRATRDRLAAVLAEAANVPDILAVQDRITAVQVEIEQLQGQQRLLEDQTSFATLAVTLGEPGAEIAVATTPDDGLGEAWDDARERFGDSLERLVSWSGSAAVVALVGIVLLGLGRLVWVPLRRRLV